MSASTPKAATRVGVFGGGQLGRMLAQAGLPLGLSCRFVEQAPECPAAVLGPVVTSAALDDFAQQVEVVTLEFENTPLADVDCLPAGLPLWPPRAALATAQNRLLEKALFDRLQIPVPAYRAVHTRADLEQALQELGLPLVVKTATGGYDGKGQAVMRERDALDSVWAQLGAGQVALIAEAFVPFEREVSIIAVRGQDGDIRCWPLAENHHHHGILSHSVVPAPNSQALTPLAQDYISRLLSHFEYVGVLTLELFVTANGLMANEMAPRVHNSGHWSIEGAVCSQFENHMRAVAGLPLGSTALVQPCRMINIIGEHPVAADVLAVPGAHLHLYGKTARAGRKLGHITLTAPTCAELDVHQQQIARILPNPMALLSAAMMATGIDAAKK